MIRHRLQRSVIHARRADLGDHPPAAASDDRARSVLRLLATGLIAGYLSERFSRQLLTPARFDPVETPIVAVGLAGAVAMAVVGARRQAGR